MQISNTEYHLYETVWAKKTETAENNNVVVLASFFITAWKSSLTFLLKVKCKGKAISLQALTGP
jgi:hypothetical protein